MSAGEYHALLLMPIENAYTYLYHQTLHAYFRQVAEVEAEKEARNGTKD